MNLVDRVRDIVQPRYETISWEHGWPHVSSVVNNLQLLAEIVKVDTELCQVAAYCHDLGRVVEKKGPELGSSEHAADSVSETIKLLTSLKVSDYQLSTVVSAVSVHSDRVYGGKNLIAKVLRDCDKKDALGPWGTLRCAKHWFKRDLVPTEEIITNKDNYSTLVELAQQTIQIIKTEQQLLKIYLNNLNFVLEWIDNKMLDNKESYQFLQSGYAYSREERLFLLDDTLRLLTDESECSSRRRALHFFHEPSFKGPQFGVGVIQKDSYVQPHARFKPESLFYLQGKIASLQFDERGKLIRRVTLSEETPFVQIPANTFHTILALEDNSAFGVTVFGPQEQVYRREAPFAPNEKIVASRNYHDYLRSLV